MKPSTRRVLDVLLAHGTVAAIDLKRGNLRDSAGDRVFVDASQPAHRRAQASGLRHHLVRQRPRARGLHAAHVRAAVRDGGGVVKATETLTVPDVGVNPSWKCAQCQHGPSYPRGRFERREVGFPREASQSACLRGRIEEGERMRLIRIESQSRRDFTGVYECEGCGHTKRSYGYDDRNFHDNVIPNMKCEKCGESTITLGGEVAHTPTRYADWEVV